MQIRIVVNQGQESLRVFEQGSRLLVSVPINISPDPLLPVVTFNNPRGIINEFASSLTRKYGRLQAQKNNPPAFQGCPVSEFPANSLPLPKHSMDKILGRQEGEV